MHDRGDTFNPTLPSQGLLIIKITLHNLILKDPQTCFFADGLPIAYVNTSLIDRIHSLVDGDSTFGKGKEKHRGWGFVRVNEAAKRFSPHLEVIW